MLTLDFQASQWGECISRPPSHARHPSDVPIHRQQFEGSAKEGPVVLVFLHFLRPSTHFYVHITRKSKGFLISGNVGENKTREPLLFVPSCKHALYVRCKWKQVCSVRWKWRSGGDQLGCKRRLRVEAIIGQGRVLPCLTVCPGP